MKQRPMAKEVTLQELLKYALRTDIDKSYRRASIPNHPFGLQRLETQFVGKHHQESLRIEFVGDPNVTDTESMIKEIIKLLTYGTPRNDQPNIKLRVLFVRADVQDESKHRVFYEIASVGKTVMCGGCTDFSGGGKIGKQTMDDLFDFLSEVYRTEIQRVIIPYENSREIIRNLREEIRKYNEG
jgi:hypothetical protein